MVVTGGCENFLNAIAHFDDRNIERTAAEVINHNLLVGFLVDAIGKSGSCGLVDDSLDVKAGNLACILGCLTLRVSEVSGNGDNRFGYLRAEIRFCVCLQLLKNHSGNFLRRESLAVDVDFISGAHLTFNG